MPEAPGIFSTNIGRPKVRDTLSAISRAMISVAAPGPVGTISLIGRLGQVCALAALPIERAMHHNDTCKIRFSTCVVVSSLLAQYLSSIVMASKEIRRECHLPAEQPLRADGEDIAHDQHPGQPAQWPAQGRRQGMASSRLLTSLERCQALI